MTPEVGRARVTSTQRRILQAARELFIELGYSDTTLSAVAKRAGVGDRTVYLRFGSKGTVLLEAADLARDGAPTAHDGRPISRDSRPTSPDAGPAGTSEGSLDPVQAYARMTRERFERLGGLVRVLLQASATEPFVAVAMQEARAANRKAAAVAVPTGRARAIETVAVLGSAETWLQLIDGAGWTADDYQGWLVETIRAVTAR